MLTLGIKSMREKAIQDNHSGHFVMWDRLNLRVQSNKLRYCQYIRLTPIYIYHVIQANQGKTTCTWKLAITNGSYQKSTKGIQLKIGCFLLFTVLLYRIIRQHTFQVIDDFWLHILNVWTHANTLNVIICHWHGFKVYQIKYLHIY